MTTSLPRTRTSPPRSQPRHRNSRARWRMPWMALATALIFVLGVAVLLAPTVANWFSQQLQAAEIEEATRAAEQLAPTERENAIQAAKVYNTTLIGGAVVAANERIPLAAEDSVTPDELNYNKLLLAAPDGLMGRVKIPKIAVDQPIYHGTDDLTLQNAIGHLEGTSLPVGGIGTRTVLTGHRGLATSELFTRLDEVVVGDTFTIEVFGEVLTYRVTTTEVVEPTDSRALYPDATRDLATLVTCTPLGINSHRILVTGERVTPTPIEDVKRAGEGPTIPGFPWWALIAGAALIGAIVYVILAGFPRKRRRKTAQANKPAESSSAQPDTEGTPPQV